MNNITIYFLFIISPFYTYFKIIYAFLYLFSISLDWFSCVLLMFLFSFFVAVFYSLALNWEIRWYMLGFVQDELDCAVGVLVDFE